MVAGTIVVIIIVYMLCAAPCNVRRIQYLRDHFYSCLSHHPRRSARVPRLSQTDAFIIYSKLFGRRGKKSDKMEWRSEWVNKWLDSMFARREEPEEDENENCKTLFNLPKNCIHFIDYDCVAHPETKYTYKERF